MRKMMITGVSGLLGNNLALYFKKRFEITGIYCSHKVDIDGVKTLRADLRSFDDTVRLIKDVMPDIIINCAALASPDLCEIKKELAEQLNIRLVANIVNVIKASNIKLIHISTDMIFDGKKGNYIESDKVNPINFYGETKYKGEIEALRYDNTIVARTNIFGRNIINKYCLAEWIINELSNGRQITGFTDAIFSSIYTMELAKLLDAAIDKDIRGIYHFASRDSLSKYEFAIELAKTCGLDPTLIRSGSVDDFGFTAKRAKNVSLNVTKLLHDVGASIPTIVESIQSFCQMSQINQVK